jgi:hypothetical protein
MDNRRPDFDRDIRINGTAKVSVITLVVDLIALQDALKTACEAIALVLAVGGILSWALAACIVVGG